MIEIVSEGNRPTVGLSTNQNIAGSPGAGKAPGEERMSEEGNNTATRAADLLRRYMTAQATGSDVSDEELSEIAEATGMDPSILIENLRARQSVRAEGTGPQALGAVAGPALRAQQAAAAGQPGAQNVNMMRAAMQARDPIPEGARTLQDLGARIGVPDPAAEPAQSPRRRPSPRRTAGASAPAEAAATRMTPNEIVDTAIRVLHDAIDKRFQEYAPLVELSFDVGGDGVVGITLSVATEEVDDQGTVQPGIADLAHAETDLGQCVETIHDVFDAGYDALLKMVEPPARR